jgi:hypothetical protein
MWICVPARAIPYGSKKREMASCKEAQNRSLLHPAPCDFRGVQRLLIEFPGVFQWACGYEERRRAIFNA